MLTRLVLMAAAFLALNGVVLAGGPALPGDRMGNPLHRQIVSVFVLPEMQPELGLSPQQISALHRQKQELLAKSDEIAGEIAVRRRELDQLLSGDTSRTRTVRALFEQIAGLQAQLQYSGFETASKMKAVLSGDQRAKFNAMKPMDLHHVMMSRGNMAEIERTMERMGVERGADNPGDNMMRGAARGMRHGG
jgi:Spy/CpxP family protein refolding chaperone